MENKNSVREIVFASLLVTTGIVLPMIFHFFGLGSAFLPMHIPVLISGFILPLPYAVAVGAITPLLSSILTGMPPLFPIMTYMVFELAAYASAASFLGKKKRLNVYIALVGSMIAGRIVSGIVVWILVTVFGAKLPNTIIFIASSISTGLPGIIIQIAAIPPMVAILRKTNIITSEVINIEE